MSFKNTNYLNYNRCNIRSENKGALDENQSQAYIKMYIKKQNLPALVHIRLYYPNSKHWTMTSAIRLKEPPPPKKKRKLKRCNCGVEAILLGVDITITFLIILSVHYKDVFQFKKEEHYKP